MPAVDGIVDAHHHIWRRADLPWLAGPMQPRIFGPYEVIRRDYPVVLGSLFLFTIIRLLTRLARDLSYLWVDPRVRFSD